MDVLDDLMTHARNRGFRFAVNGDKLTTTGDIKKFPEIADAITKRKTEVIAYLLDEKDRESKQDSRVPTWDDLHEWNSSNGGTANNGNGNARKLQLVRLDTVTPTDITWLWKNRKAKGKVTLMAGDPGHGKSLLSASMAATVTKGWKWPDGALGCTPGNVLMLCAEDGLADTLVPRLIKLGADLTKIHAIQGVEYQNKELTKRVFNFRCDMAPLLEAFHTIKPELLIIDPVSSYMDGIDQHKNGDVRSALQPLVEAAEEHQTAVLMVTHLSKAQARSALSAATGSLAFGALARQAHLVIPDPDDQTGRRRFFLCMKSNIGPRPAGLAFEIDHDGVVRWSADAVNVDANDVLRRSSQGDKRVSKVDAAKAWLERLRLDEKSLPAKEVTELAADSGITYSTLKRAFDDMGGVASRDEFQGAYMWTIPTADVITEQEF